MWSRSLDRFSCSMWFNASGLTGQTYRNLFGAVDSSGNDQVSLFLTTDGPGLGTNYYVEADVTSSGYGSQYRTVFSTNAVQSLGTWFHALLTFDLTEPVNSDRLKLYINGILQSNGSNSGTQSNIINIDSSTKGLLGAFEVADPGKWKGYMRDFRWWNSPLTDTDAVNVYNNMDESPTPNYWLKMDDGPTNPIDFINTANIAFLTNGAFFADRDHPKIPFEPDYDKFVLDLRFETLVGELFDYSGMGNNADIFGEPCPTSASMNFRGGSKRNTGWSFTQSDKVYCTVLDSNDFNIGATETTGHSWIFRVNFKSLLESGNRSQTLVEHHDDGSNKFSIRVGNDGNLKYLVKRLGTEYKMRTNTSPVTVNTDLELACTYNAGTNVIKLYVDGIPMTTTTSTDVLDAFNFNDLYVFSHVPVSTLEPVLGFCDFNYVDCVKMYQAKVLTDAQVLNHYRNKVSISDFGLGEGCILDDCAMAHEAPSVSVSFTDTSFTTTSFTAG